MSGAGIVQVGPGLTEEGIALLDPTPIADFLDRYIDYERVCKSGVDLTIVVLPAIPFLEFLGLLPAPWRKDAKYLNVRDLDPLQVRQALLAAIAVPYLFPSKRIGNQSFADAGWVDPLPAQILYQGGAKYIVSIFLSDSQLQNRADFSGCVLFQIRPSVNIDTGIGSTFDFSRQTIDSLSLINLGYEDARSYYGEAYDIFSRLVSLKERGDQIIKLADSLPDRRQRKT